MNIKAYLALAVVYIIWGTTIVAMQVGVQSIPAVSLPCIRFLISGLLLVAFCLLRQEKWPGWEDLKNHLWVGLMLFVGGNSLTCFAVQHISTGLSGLMVATTPFWMVWLSSRMPPYERISKGSLAGIVLGFIGLMVLLSPNIIHPLGTSAMVWGSILMMLVTAFSWSLGSIYARKYPSKSSILMSVGMQNLFAGLALVPVSLATWPHEPVQISNASLAALAYLILLGTIAATPCYLYVVRTMPVSVSSTFAYVTPVMTVVFGAIFLHETVGFSTVLGSIIILSGVMLVQWVNLQKASPIANDSNLKPAWKGALFK